MNKENKATLAVENRPFRYLYGVTLFFIALSGFAQMPIFKRYYIADVPGLGWLAQYYVTHIIHYLAAAVLIWIFVYRLTDHFLSYRKKRKLSPSGYVRGGLLLGLILTGSLMVIKNFQGQLFSDRFIVSLDLAHISFMLLFLFSLLYGLIFKKKWTIKTD
jgi:hypothetical protein